MAPVAVHSPSTAADEFLEAVAEQGRLRELPSVQPGLSVVVISNSRKDHVASFLHGSGLARYVFLATNREHFDGRDAALKRDLAERLGITMERLVSLQDKDHQFLDGARCIRGIRNDMRFALAKFQEHGIVPSDGSRIAQAL